MLTTEELLIRVMNQLAEKFKDKLVLKGGMLLRLYNSPRTTQDVDFILLTKGSKKIWMQKIVKALEELEEVQIEEVELNSRGIIIDLVDANRSLKAMIEINVLPATRLSSEPISTAPLSQKYSLGARVISAMTIPEAFSHKIAASLERNAIRDLYDLSQMEAMGRFDEGTLRDRLSRLCIKRSKPRSLTVAEAVALLKEKIRGVDQKAVEKDLYPFLPPEYRPGVLNLIRASVGRVIQRLEQLDPSK